MRKIKYVKLQGSEAFIPGFGSFGTTLCWGRQQGGSKTFDLEIYENGDKLIIKGIRGNLKTEAFVPITNVQIAEYFEESATKATE